jgi:hypothetical protein
MLRYGMTQRIKLRSSDLAHRLAASLHRHVRLLADPTGRYKLRVSHYACFEVAKQQAAEFEEQNAEIFLEISDDHSWPPRDPPADKA